MPDGTGNEEPNGRRPTRSAPQAIVLLHGWTSTAALNWFRCFEPLSRQWQIVAPDLRGHGRGVRGRPPFRLSDAADDVAALVDAMGLGRVVVVGYSMGGPVALLVWRRHREAVAGLVLCATAARFAARSEVMTPLAAVGFGLSVALSGIPAPLRQEGLRRIVRSRWSDGAAAWVIEEWERADPAALMQAALAMRSFDATGWLGEIDVPVSVVVTTKDSTVPSRSQWKLASLIPGAQTFSVDGDHRACVDDAERFLPALFDACRHVGGG
jgi:3-oxoadipate enol-lactonase